MSSAYVDGSAAWVRASAPEPVTGAFWRSLEINPYSLFKKPHLDALVAHLMQKVALEQNVPAHSFQPVLDLSLPVSGLHAARVPAPLVIAAKQLSDAGSAKLGVVSLMIVLGKQSQSVLLTQRQCRTRETPLGLAGARAYLPTSRDKSVVSDGHMSQAEVAEKNRQMRLLMWYFDAEMPDSLAPAARNVQADLMHGPHYKALIADLERAHEAWLHTEQEKAAAAGRNADATPRVTRSMRAQRAPVVIAPILFPVGNDEQSDGADIVFSDDDAAAGGNAVPVPAGQGGGTDDSDGEDISASDHDSPDIERLDRASNSDSDANADTASVDEDDVSVRRAVRDDDEEEENNNDVDPEEELAAAEAAEPRVCRVKRSNELTALWPHLRRGDYRLFYQVTFTTADEIRLRSRRYAASIIVDNPLHRTLFGPNAIDDCVFFVTRRSVLKPPSVVHVERPQAPPPPTAVPSCEQPRAVAVESVAVAVSAAPPQMHIDRPPQPVTWLDELEHIDFGALHRYEIETYCCTRLSVGLGLLRAEQDESIAAATHNHWLVRNYPERSGAKRQTLTMLSEGALTRERYHTTIAVAILGMIAAGSERLRENFMALELAIHSHGRLDTSGLDDGDDDKQDAEMRRVCATIERYWASCGSISDASPELAALLSRLETVWIETIADVDVGAVDSNE